MHANRQRKNPIGSVPDERERDFFGKLSKPMILKLFELYKADFKMFGYEDQLDKYLDMGIED